MSIETNKINRSLTYLSLSLYVTVASVAGADEQGVDPYQAIHDYEDSASTSYSEVRPVSHMGGYKTLMVLDEAYHDYDEGETMKFNTSVKIPTVEIAAFEEVRTFADIVPWELQIND